MARTKQNIATITVRQIVAGKSNKQVLSAIRKAYGKDASSESNVAWYRSRIAKGFIDAAKYAVEKK